MKMIHNTRTRKQQSGDAAESAAIALLKQQGLTLVARNYQCKHGEIDIVMREGSTLVFVEVRLRRSSAFGSAAESVTAGKQRKVIASAQHYLITHGLSANTPLRFDVVASDGDKLDWIPAAF